MRDYITMVIIIVMTVLLLMIAGVVHAGVVEDVIAYESSGECFEGQVAVAKVIMNRSKAWRKTTEQIVTARNQFSCIKDGKYTQCRVLLPLERESASEALKMAHKCMLKSLYYKRTDCKSPWFDKMIKKGVLVEECRIGAHTFYEEIR